MIDIGEQYPLDESFKAAARLHQSQYRANVLQVECNEYGNRLTEPDAKAHLNYYEGLNVRRALKIRYPNDSISRDGDMLRSEHIPFNMLAPLLTNQTLAKHIIKTAFWLESEAPYVIEIEFAPKPKQNYLDDATSFDTFISFTDRLGKKIGLGIEVKYTEKGYPYGKTEKQNVENKKSPYWQVTRQSSAFLDDNNTELQKDAYRQIWRNHLIGLSMCQRKEIDDFYSIILYPSGNQHFNKAIPEYQSFLIEPQKVFGCTYEKYIQAIEGNEEIMKWKRYLTDRYIVREEHHS